MAQNHHVWNKNFSAVYGGAASPLWAIGNVYPLSGAVEGSPHTDTPPGTGTTYPTPANSVRGIATQKAIWAAYWRDGISAAHGRDIGGGYALTTNQLGAATVGVSRTLFGDPGDYVTGLTSGTGRADSPLNATGRAAVLAIAQTVAEGLAEDLDDLELGNPAALHCDNERGPSPFTAGNWDPALLSGGTEPKGGTEVLYDSSTYQQLRAAPVDGAGSAIGAFSFSGTWW